MLRYFEEEMRYLHEEGKTFAEKHPEQARYLNIDSLNDRDPFVERLFEGFAFLAGRINERLDDELPEYAEGFFSLMYPHFLKPIPSLSIVEFRPDFDQLSETIDLDAGVEILSLPAGPENTICRFTTTESIRVRPLVLSGCELVLEEDTTHSIVLSMKVAEGARIDSSEMSSVRLQFSADTMVASTMHMFFTRHVENVRIECEGAESMRTRQFDGQSSIQPGGFGPDEGLLPYSARTSPGSRLMLEYLNFRTRFLCVDLLGLDQLGPLDGGDSIRVRIKLNRTYPADKAFSAENILLHCCPIINLFTADADPVRVLPTQAEYRITADGSFRNSVETYDFLNVVGIEERTGIRHTYLPYYEFERDDEGEGRFFVQSFRMGPDDKRTVHLSLSTNQDWSSGMEEEVLSMTIRATNRNTSREYLQEGFLNIPGQDVPSFLQVSNITQPSLYLNPPLKNGKDYYWKLLSHLALSRTSIGSAIELREMLNLYNWIQSDGNTRRIRGIRSVSWAGKDLIVRGGVLRGAEITIEVAEDHFPDEGDLCLFGLVLSEFFSMYATINSFIHLKMISKPSEKTYEWRPKKGLQPLV